MRYVACKNKECDNKGAPYHFEDGDDTEIDCPMCGEPTREIPDPTKEQA